jgi:hypothetical protein
MSDKYDVTVHYKDGGMDRYRDVIGVTFEESILTLEMGLGNFVCAAINSIKFWTRRKEEKA